MNDKTLYAIVLAPIVFALLYVVYLSTQKESEETNIYHEQKFYTTSEGWI